MSLSAVEFYGGSYVVVNVPEAASQSFKKGQFVYLASGKATVATASSGIFGMALEDATGTTDTQLAVLVSLRDTIFRGCVYHSTAASAVTAVTDVGTTTFGINQVSNISVVDKENTTHDSFSVIGLDPTDAVGATYGRVYFRVNTGESAGQNDDTSA